MKTLLFVPLLVIGLVGCETRVSFSSAPAETVAKMKPPSVKDLSKVCINGVVYYEYGPSTYPMYTPAFESVTHQVETCTHLK